MKDVFFTWQGGEGGDFLLHVLAQSLKQNKKSKINHVGCVLNSAGKIKIEWSFKHGNFNFRKAHLLWNDKLFLQSTDKFVFFIVNPDINMLLRKKMKKFLTNPPGMSMDIFTNSNHKFINKKILQSVKKNDYKSLYYYGYKSHKQSYSSYFESTQKILKKVSHAIIKTKFTSYKDIIDSLAIVSQKLGIDFEIDNDLRLFCLDYIEIQKQYEEEWPYLDY